MISHWHGVGLIGFLVVVYLILGLECSRIEPGPLPIDPTPTPTMTVTASSTRVPLPPMSPAPVVPAPLGDGGLKHD